MNFIEGGVCAPIGFKAGGVHCGIRKHTDKKDLALIVSEVRASSASVYTQNLVKGAPILVTKENIKDGMAQAIICNSGNANTCNSDGIDVAKQMCQLTEKYTGINRNDVIVASTGVIGQKLNIEPIASKMNLLTASLGNNSADAAAAIMTTDTVKKEFAIEFEIGGVKCRLGGIAKGSGMIHPNMATMLVFITTDVSIKSEMLQKALSEDVKTSFNMISVDGDTSTNDMVSILANGLAQNRTIDNEGEDFAKFKKALNMVTVYLCRQIAADGEGASKLLECKVSGAKTADNARAAAKSVICSALFKAAMFGADANWGRVLCALGYSGEDLDVNKIDVSFKSQKGEILVCKSGAGVDFSEEKAKEILVEKEIEILIALNDGQFSATAWGCDLTYDYVRINGDYRS
ncbi:arginine biosynthesis bifunctional protein ArgJ [Clostridiales bacterium]|nr:arginine biosynthesis bifunctional protein ArgJ [Clostridiales bacterium]